MNGVFPFFFFFARYLGGFVFFGIFGSWDPRFPAKKKRKNNTMVRNIIRKRVGRDKLNTCAEFQGLSLKNGVDI